VSIRKLPEPEPEGGDGGCCLLLWVCLGFTAWFVWQVVYYLLSGTLGR
jgi:hypothetical protein